MQLVKRKAGSGSLEEAERGAQGAGFGKMEDWDRVKISIPLERIVKKAVSDYMAFATLLVLGIDNRQPGEGVGDDEPVELQFALLSSQLHFLDIFEHALKASNERKAARPAGELGPFPVLDLDGSLRFFLNNPEGASSRAAAAGEEKLEDGGSGKGGEEEGVGDSQLRANFGLGEHEPIWCRFHLIYFLVGVLAGRLIDFLLSYSLWTRSRSRPVLWPTYCFSAICRILSQDVRFSQYHCKNCTPLFYWYGFALS